MKTTKWDAFLKERHSDEEIAASKCEAQEELKLLDLQRLRKLKGKTQAEIAEKLHVTQAELSRVERRANLTLATLQGVIEALGGKLQITAQFEDKAYHLMGAWTESRIPAPEVIAAHNKKKSAGRRSRTGH